MKKIRYKGLIHALAFVALSIVLSGCAVTKKSKSSNKTDVSSEVKTEIKVVTETKFVDTGSIKTIREIEYRTIYDTINKRFVVVKWKVRESIDEKKALNEQTSSSGTFVQEAKKDSTNVVKQADKTIKNGNAWKFYLGLVIFGIIIFFIVWNYKKYF